MNTGNARKLIVEQMDWLAPDVYQICLQGVNGDVPSYLPSCLLGYLPGQYLSLHLDECNVGSYSIGSAAESGLLEIQIKTTANNHQLLHNLRSRSRSTVMVDMPHGCCRLPSSERPLLMLAGGTGVSQMRSIIYSSIARCESRSMWLYWGVDCAASLYLDHELKELSRQHPRFHYESVVDTAEPNWLGRVGCPHECALLDFETLTDFEIVFSGSKNMAKTLYRDFSTAGVDQSRMHCDWLDILRAQGSM